VASLNIFISKNGDWTSEHSETFDAIFHFFIKKIRRKENVWNSTIPLTSHNTSAVLCSSWLEMKWPNNNNALAKSFLPLYFWEAVDFHKTEFSISHAWVYSLYAKRIIVWEFLMFCLFWDVNSALRIQQTEKGSAVKPFFRVEERNCPLLGVFFVSSPSSLVWIPWVGLCFCLKSKAGLHRLCVRKRDHWVA
jgi:hypothetical protein